MATKVSYIGAGGFSSRFIHPQLHRHDVFLAAICDLDERRARRAAACHGFERVYLDFREMLEVEQPDVVFCVGPHQMQYEVGLQVLRAGFPLYVQKPAANSAERVREMAEAAEQAGAICHCGFNLRSAPAVRRTAHALASDQFGAPSLAVFRYGLMSREVWREAILDQHVHAIDTMLHLLGDWRSAQVTPTLQEGTRGYVAVDEMEPGTFKDRVLVHASPHQLIEGIILTAFAMKASQAIVFIRMEYENAARIMEREIGLARQAGLLGNNIRQSGFTFDITV
ncbi:MAG: Gfo/Idh/MocA family oxidoreductase, partial [Armatimonadota bacterium]